MPGAKQNLNELIDRPIEASEDDLLKLLDESPNETIVESFAEGLQSTLDESDQERIIELAEELDSVEEEIDETGESTEEDEELITASQKGVVIRTSLKSINILGRSTQGVRIMKLDPGDKVASAVIM